jgi:type II secretory ATPase GspE/PulE/Tfp pilus assembly ATPase PilB-like protein
LTGHIVFSTLHTNDAPSAITRLIDMGVEPFLISSSLIGVISQRLIRLICPKCKEEYAVSGSTYSKLGINEDIKLAKGKGCGNCLGTGYKGRIGIFELMIPDEKIRNLTINKTPLEDLRKAAISSGMTTLREDGIDKAKKHLTTIEEVMRVTVADIDT